ncbi:zinc finger BED domain-containing protein 5-like [Procambarus clarkii]|uniref:zinc finger BED domain-containing protein 5-like n=1 Tax=Procambarus clarkii TaxID=6728 RepID=UPI003744A414
MSIYKYFKKIDGNPEPAKPVAVGAAVDATRKDDVSNQDGAASQDFTEERKTSKKDAFSSRKKRRKRWNDEHIVFGFFRTVHEASNPFPPAKCFFCYATYSNENFVPSKLARHLKTKHIEHQNKSQQFFVATLEAYLKQQSTFKSHGKPSDMRAFTLASLKMTHIVLQKKKHSLNLKIMYCRVLK